MFISETSLLDFHTNPDFANLIKIPESHYRSDNGNAVAKDSPLRDVLVDG